MAYRLYECWKQGIKEQKKTPKDDFGKLWSNLIIKKKKIFF